MSDYFDFSYSEGKHEQGAPINIFNYRGKETTISLSQGYDDINFIYVIIVSGDEILKVHYNDYTSQSFDGGLGDRTIDFYDYSYVVYPADIFTWLRRSGSYDYKSRN